MQHLKERVLRNLSTVPVSRDALSHKLNVKDRTLREAITQLRAQGVPICSNSEASGYWLATNTSEIQHTISEYRSRAIKMLKIAKALERGIEKDNVDGC